jgi:hypothetical protein
VILKSASNLAIFSAPIPNGSIGKWTERVRFSHLDLNEKLVEDPFYYTNLVAYIHTNPIKHGLTTDLYEWTYSSFHAYTSYKNSQVKTDIVLDFFGGKKELIDFHQNFNDALVENMGLDLE